MVICDEVYQLNLVKGHNVGNPRFFEAYFECTKVILDLVLVRPCIEVRPNILLHGLNILDHIRVNNMAERREYSEVDVVGVQLVCLDPIVLVENVHTLVAIISKVDVEVDHGYITVIFIITVLIFEVIII